MAQWHFLNISWELMEFWKFYWLVYRLGIQWLRLIIIYRSTWIQGLWGPQYRLSNRMAKTTDITLMTHNYFSVKCASQPQIPIQTLHHHFIYNLINIYFICGIIWLLSIIYTPHTYAEANLVSRVLIKLVIMWHL